jgi:hypothetical protein
MELIKMTTEIAKTHDGFDYEDGTEGEERTSVIKGTLVKFTNDASWVVHGDEELPDDLELAVIDIGRVVQKWADGNPVETRVLAPDEKFPDIKQLNADTPREEWIEGPDGQERGPWQAQHLVYLLDLETMDVYTYATGTVGGSIAVRDIRERTNWMRRLRGSDVFPVVTLSDVHMNTRFGGRQRPHFKVARWVALGSNGGDGVAVEGPKAPQLTALKKPTVAEEIGDELPH